MSDKSPQTADIVAANYTAQGLAISAPPTVLPAYSTREIRISATVDDCRAAMASSHIIDAPPFASVDATGRLVGGTVYSAADGLAVRSAMAEGVLAACPG